MFTPRPIVTFTSDFGFSDAYVAEMKAAVLKRCPDATLVDITHGISPQNIIGGAIAIARAIGAFPASTIHVAVVDPGVGTNRKLLVANINEQTILLPDNGLLTWAYRNFPQVYIQELLWRPASAMSQTFHGRDILAPVAGLLAAGQHDQIATQRLDHPVLLDLHPATSLAEAVVIHIDSFGNLITNVPQNLVTSETYVLDIGHVRRTYADVEIGDPVALIGSSGLLEIAVRNQNAAAQLDYALGSKVRFRR